MARPPTTVHTRPRSRWQTVHRWLGVGIGLWFMLVGLTGALLVWRDELDAWLNPPWFTARAAGPALELEPVIDRLRGELGFGRVERIRLPAAPGEVLRLQVRAHPSRVEAARQELFVDPASGALLGRRALEGLSLAPPHALRTLYEFHRNVLLGEPGSNIVGTAGLLLMTSAISGVVVAWPRTRGRWRRLLAVSWRANATRVALDLHRSFGVVMASLVLLATATGATLVWLNVVRDAVGRLSPVRPIPVLPFRTVAPGQELLSLEDLRGRVRAAYPRGAITEIRLTERGLSGVLFQVREPGDVQRLGDTLVWLHPATGERLAERSARTRSAGESFMHWLLPLHVGSAFGTAGAVAMAAVGAAPLLLVSSGLWVWWRKRASEQIGRERERRRAGGAGSS